MKYRVPLVAIVDFGDGVKLEDEAASLPELAGDLVCTLQDVADVVNERLANSESIERRWHVEVDFEEPGTDTEGPADAL